MLLMTSSISGSAMATPTRQPVMRKFLEKLFRVMTPVGKPRDRADRDEVPLIEVGGIDLIRRDQQVMFLRHPAQQLQRGAVIAHAGGVAGIVEHNELGAGGNGRPETGLRQWPSIACIGGDLHAHTAGQFRLGAVEGEVGGKDDDLVTGSRTDSITSAIPMLLEAVTRT